MNLKIFTDNVEEKALSQINNLVAQPAFSECKIRIMPDIHAGAGCVIGFTANLGDKVIPNIVGVDIGCGMLTIPLGPIRIDYEKLDDVINEQVPHGMDAHDHALPEFYRYFNLQDLHCYRGLKDIDWLERSLGTLGGGNHFIEVDEGDFNEKFLVIHTGSRNLGKQVCEYYQNLAIRNMSGKAQYLQDRKDLISKLKEEGRESEIAGALRTLEMNRPEASCPKELCWLEGADRQEYLDDMRFCQRFASWNREIIAKNILAAMNWGCGDGFETIHNYIGDDNTVRKGAISAREGERVLIPINMRDGCIIGVGKGNADWNYSAPHGAGRIMSRAEARRRVTLDEFAESMRGVYTTSVGLDTIDESPMAYKTMDEILKYIQPTVEVEAIIKPVYNFKAGE